jgi:transcriptional regulator with GAF, ATPase, and Fis domain
MGGKRNAAGLRAQVEALERALIVEALEKSGGNQRQAAAALALSPTCLHEKLKRLGIRVVHEVTEAPALDEEEREQIMAALAESSGQLHRAAAALRMSPSALRERLGRLHVQVVARTVVGAGRENGGAAEAAPPGETLRSAD